MSFIQCPHRASDSHLEPFLESPLPSKNAPTNCSRSCQQPLHAVEVHACEEPPITWTSPTIAFPSNNCLHRFLSSKRTPHDIEQPSPFFRHQDILSSPLEAMWIIAEKRSFFEKMRDRASSFSSTALCNGRRISGRTPSHCYAMGRRSPALPETKKGWDVHRPHLALNIE